MLTVLIPMAGKGSRFSAAGFDRPKPLIEVAGKTLAERSISTLGLPNAHYVFVTRTFDKPEYNEELTEIFTKLCKSFTEIRIDSEHRGAAHSALYAKKYIDKDDELIITNCDQSIIFDTNNFLNNVRDSELDGAVVTHISDDPKHSFVQLYPNESRALKIVEKDPISEWALTGIHYWKKAEDFFSSAESMTNSFEKMGYPELYVSITYNELISQGKTIISYPITGPERFFSLGTPEDVLKFLNIKSFFEIENYAPGWEASHGDLDIIEEPHKHFIINDIVISSPNDGDEIILDNVFLFNGIEKSFYHGIIENVGQYLALKSIYEDLVPLNIEFAPQTRAPDFSASFIEEIVGAGIVNLKNIGEGVSKIYINKLFLVTPVGSKLTNKFFINHVPEILSAEYHAGNRAYIKWFAGAVRAELLSTIEPRELDKNKKIFIHSSNKLVGENSELIDEQDKRFASKSEYDKVVEQFVDLGYTAVHPEALNIFDQISMIKSAESIATVKGSNSVHSIFADAETNFTMVNLTENNTFPHETLVECFINNPSFIEEWKK